ncbi:MAG: MBL fold metallo-hydrolase [Alloprevotella sp.]
MKKYFAFVSGLLLLTACAQKVGQKTVVDGEATVITWIEDKPEPTLQPHNLYPDVPDSLWIALGLQEGVPSSMSCFLLQTEGKNILLDAGLGAPFSQLIPKLTTLDVKPEELQLIYITHFHPDHIGGLLKDGKVVFPNAEVYINRVEAEAWQKMEGNQSVQAKTVLDAYKQHLHLFEAGDTLPGDVITIAAYGHTPGHTAFQKDSMLVIGDLIHGAALQLEYPEYCPLYDMDAETARESRLRILNYARENRLTMYGMHLPHPGTLQ